jgi:hypothetical protein
MHSAQAALYGRQRKHYTTKGATTRRRHSGSVRQVLRVAGCEPKTAGSRAYSNPNIEYLNPKQIPGTRLRVIKCSKLKAGVQSHFEFWSFDIV